MFPKAQKQAIGTVLLSAGASTKLKAETATISGTSTTVQRRVEELTSEHLARFAAGAGLSEKIDLSSTWDKVSDAGTEIGLNIALDWGIVEALGARVGGVLTFLLMPTSLNSSEGGTLALMQEQHARSIMRENMAPIADAITNDVLEQIAAELDASGYQDGCGFGDKIRKDVRAAVMTNLSILLAP